MLLACVDSLVSKNTQTPTAAVLACLSEKTAIKQWEFLEWNTDGQMYTHKPPTHPQNMRISLGNQDKNERKYP